LANRSQQGGIRDDLPLMPSLSELNIMTETHNRTMFSVVDDLDTAHTLVGATKTLLAIWNNPIQD
jgi:hypothetical protein